MGYAAERFEDSAEEFSEVTSVAPSPLDQPYMGRTKRESIKETGLVFALVVVVIAGVRQYHGRDSSDALLWIGTALLLYSLSARAPKLFYPIWRSWMAIGWFLEVTTSYLILGLSWFIMMVPMGIGLRVFRVKTMDLSWKAPVETYWEDRKEQSFELLRRQY